MVSAGVLPRVLTVLVELVMSPVVHA